jgi:hypothetical protein
VQSNSTNSTVVLIAAYPLYSSNVTSTPWAAGSFLKPGKTPDGLHSFFGVLTGSFQAQPLMKEQVGVM